MTGAAAGAGERWRWSSLRELDQAGAQAKGSAFRAFKRRLPELVEGRDFVVLDPRGQDGEAARWLAAGRLYGSSVHPVIVTPDLALQLGAELVGADHG